ncbi:hypothetical protein JXM83_01220 [Candidatus Woesearchaeota archaeon]|nr:hypothetical protein [Candidatus Woesearchaeota archaeon]
MTKNNSINISGKTSFKGDAIVGHRNKVSKTNSPTISASGSSSVNVNIQDGVKKYKGDKIDTWIYDNLAPILMGKIGEKKLIITGAISFPISILGIFSYFKGTMNIEKFLDFLPGLPYQPIIYISIVLFFIGAISLGTVAYFHDRKCKKCNTPYAYEESRLPDIEEVETRKGTRITTLRHYKCKHCGHEDDRESSTLIEKEDNSN